MVADTEDERSRPTQNILCKLGEKVLLSYRKPPPNDCEDRHEIGIGRPVGEDNNAHPDHSRHDIRELKLNVVVFSTTGAAMLDGAINAGRKTIKVAGDLADARDSGFIRIQGEIIHYDEMSVGSRTFRHCERGAEGTVAAAHAKGVPVFYCTTTPAATLAEVLTHLDNLDERLAQSGIRTKKPVPIDIALGRGVVLPPDILGGWEQEWKVLGSGAGERPPTASERAATRFKDPDVNSIDIFFVDAIWRPPGHSVLAYSQTAENNHTGVNDFQNSVVMSRKSLPGPFALSHEIMHILLNRGHRGGEPQTAVFFMGGYTTKAPESTKRIGPYPDADAQGVGQRDTLIIRAMLRLFHNETWLSGYPELETIKKTCCKQHVALVSLR